MIAQTGNVRWMFHGTAMVSDYDATIEPLRRLFGARVLHDNVVEDQGIGRRGGMTWIGDGSLEVGEPAGERSPVRAFIERFGGGMHSVGLQIRDVDAAKERFASLGVRVASEPWPGLLFTHPADTAGLLFEWNAHPQDDDPRWGAPVPPGPPGVVPVERLAFMAAVTRDPRTDAARIAEILGTGVIHEDHVGAHGIAATVSLVDCTLALFPMEGSGWDRPRVFGMGLVVGDLALAEAALVAHGVPVARRSARSLELAAGVLPFSVYLCEDLLLGDPANDERTGMTDELAAGDPVLCVIDQGVATVTLNRPERMNAWNMAMEEAYFALLEDLARSADVRAIVLTGAGRGFCPGLDMADLGNASRGGTARDNEQSILHALRVGKPMIAAINGACAGIGLVQALTCDVRFAAEGVKIATSFARRGLVAEVGASWFLPRIIGHARALDLLLSGRTITADEAYELGLVNAVVPADQVLDSAQLYARDLAENCSPVAMAAIKRQVYDDWLRTPIASEDEWRRLVGQPHRKADLREGVASYVERRAPRFAPFTGDEQP